MHNCVFTLATSDLWTIPIFVNRAFLFVDFFVKMWLLKACFLFNLPLPVTVNLFLALDFVFILGIFSFLFYSQLIIYSLRYPCPPTSTSLQRRGTKVREGRCGIFSYFFFGLIIMIIFFPSNFGICSNVP